MEKYEFSGRNELSEKAFAVYSSSDFTFWKERGIFFYSDNPYSEKIELGSIENVNEFLEQFVE